MATQHDIQERAFRFALRIIAFCRNLRERYPIVSHLSYELLKSGTSVGANLEEADVAQSKADFIAKCSISRKEAFEARYWLRLIAAAEVRTQPEAAPLISESHQIGKVLTAIIKSARSSATPRRAAKSSNST